MAILNMKTPDPAGTGRGKEVAHEHEGTGHDDACRCKEASEMTPGQLLRIMFNDLAFWKKTKKD